MRLVFALFLAFSVISVPLQSSAKSSHPQSVTIGFIPGEDTEALKKNGVEFAKALQSRLGVQFNIYISKNYSGLIDAMKDGKIDFAFFTAFAYVEAEKRAGAKVLLKKVWDGPFYYSAIITTKKSGVNSLEKLRGKRFGFVDEKSASGRLYPLVEFKKRGIDPEKFFKSTKYYGQHDGSVKALFADEVDAVAVYSDDAKGKNGAWTRFAPEKKGEVKILWMSDAIPNDPFCVRQDFYDSYPLFTHELMTTLIDLGEEPPERNIFKKLYGINSMDLATSRQYDPVRELVKYLNPTGK
jgi:phosphonate transport system substrate-binding protein